MTRPTDTAPRRLTEQQAEPGTAEAFVISLLKREKPYRMPVGRRHRVGSALVVRGRKRQASALLRATVALGMLACCGGAFASARALGWTDWVVERCHLLVSKMAPRPLPAARPRPPAAGAAARPAVDVAQPGPIALSATPSPLATVVSAPSPRRHAHGHVPRSASPMAGEDDSPVLAALRALRAAHDPVRARALLNAYLREHPDGTLAQEALAISIEAAVTHHDPDARSLAARYLARYPAGPFSGLARKTLGVVPSDPSGAR